MATTDIALDQDWAPQSCTLPTVEQPLRIAEFGALFTAGLTDVRRVDATRVRLMFKNDPVLEATARNLTERETQCCSFFVFAFAREEDSVDLYVEVPAAHADVLDGLEAQARGHLPSVSSS